MRRGSLSMGVSVRRGISVRKGVSVSPLYGGRVGGMNPTGMLSCFFIIFDITEKKCQRNSIYYLDILEYTLHLKGSPYYNDRC